MADSNGSKTTLIDVPKVLNTTEAGVPDAIDDVFKMSAVGPLSTAIGDSFYGINHRLTPNPLPINRDHFGLTFFTRPQMNLTSDNIRSIRQLAPLLTTRTDSLGRIIRCLLDSDLATTEKLTSPFVDQYQAFIPILTDTLVSMAGWPDVEVQAYTSAPGIYKESFSFTDDTAYIYSTYDIQATFRNIVGDPITLMILVWIYYQAAVFEGRMTPYPSNLIENVIDYQTRIYRLVLDHTRTRVQKIAACGASFPTAVPIGASFNFESDRPINSSNDQINIRFRCMGAMYQDEILIKEFNDTVCYFNSDMGERRLSTFQKLKPEELPLFNHRGYARIDPDTYELQWWVFKDDYAKLLGGKQVTARAGGLTL